MSKSKHFMTIGAQKPEKSAIVLQMTVLKGPIVGQSNPMSDYYRKLGFREEKPRKRHPLDGLVRSCTAFSDLSDMVASMEGGYVPTLPKDDPTADRLARELLDLGFRVWPER